MFFFFAFSAVFARAAEPLRALLIAGGCCHDYEAQKKIITEGISARANVVWTVVHEGNDRDHKVSIYGNPDWAKGYDVVVHNECFGKVAEVPFIEQIVRPHTNGVGAVMLHCSAHSYRETETDEWRKLLGVSSYRHQKKGAFNVVNVNPGHPVMKGFPATFYDPEDELYEIKKAWPNCVALGEGITPENANEKHVTIWVNTYGKGRVFGTTLGHHNGTMKTEPYLDLITRGLLWTCGKLDKDGKPMPGFGKK